MRKIKGKVKKTAKQNIPSVIFGISLCSSFFMINGTVSNTIISIAVNGVNIVMALISDTIDTPDRCGYTYARQQALFLPPASVPYSAYTAHN